MKKKVAGNIHANLVRALTASRTTKREAVLGALLTQTEKIMLAKRLAIVIMLERGHTYYRIDKTLKVSTSTSKRLHRKLLNGLYEPIQQMIGTGEDPAIVRMIEKLLQFRMPPKVGPGRWKFMDNHG
jgi:uncharacterized protein YerC